MNIKNDMSLADIWGAKEDPVVKVRPKIETAQDRNLKVIQNFLTNRIDKFFLSPHGEDLADSDIKRILEISEDDLGALVNGDAHYWLWKPKSFELMRRRFRLYLKENDIELDGVKNE